MEINELKKLIKNSSSVLVLDGGEPSFIVLGYETYKNIVGSKGEGEKEVRISHGPGANGNGKVQNSNEFHEKEAEILERLNKDILALKSQIEMEERSLAGQGVD